MQSTLGTLSDAEPGGVFSGAGAGTTLVRQASCDGVAATALQLLVLEPGGLSVYALPASGSVTIGRAADCDVSLGDALASRRHASIYTRPLSIQDCGSANGTRVGSKLLDAATRHSLHLGEPIAIGDTLLVVHRADAHLARGIRSRPPAARPGTERTRLVIVDPVMTRLYATLDRLADAPINVLILGETGVGKELVAEAIHERSTRKGARLIRINCAALSESLLESELFGHERGAFTGAVCSKPGLLEAADRGTVFLDEVGEMSPALQAKLLRSIEAREVQRIGSLHARRVDVRFVSATNRALSSAVEQGSFRADLFFRLNGVCLEVPPLRDRPGDVVALGKAFAERAAERMGLPRPPTFSDDAIASLLSHSWPGNVRELKNAIERAVLLGTRPEIRAVDLDLVALSIHGGRTAAPAGDSDTLRPGSKPYGSTRNAEPESEPSSREPDERARILEALDACSGNQTRAARRIGMPRRTFVAKLSRYHIPRPRRP